MIDMAVINDFESTSENIRFDMIRNTLMALADGGKIIVTTSDATICAFIDGPNGFEVFYGRFFNGKRTVLFEKFKRKRF